MNEKEQRRGQVLGWLSQGRVSSKEAQDALGVSRRHLYRLKRSFVEAGPEALAHGNRGRPSPVRLAEPVRMKIVALETPGSPCPVLIPATVLALVQNVDIIAGL